MVVHDEHEGIDVANIAGLIYQLLNANKSINLLNEGKIQRVKSTENVLFILLSFFPSLV